jgi:hypothetical protein
MTTKAQIIQDARRRLRDFPRFFQSATPPSLRTINLSRPNIDADSLWVAYIPDGGGASATVIPTSNYSLDARNGIMRLGVAPAAESILIEGYYYEWLLDDDLSFAADLAIHELSHNVDVPLEQLAPTVVDVYSLRTIVEALWNLLNEYARDIDVIAGESVHIIASQRYRMVSDLLAHWEAEYNRKAAALNIGLDRLEVMTLRRVSRTTNRLVPIYKQREVGDYSPIERIFPPIDDGRIHIEEEGDDLRTDVLVDGNPAPGSISNGYY